ncbi:hypothetical protein BV20DRAFT_1057052 [Pilatotrama ljubarskyi]|nr:hypothetical protein BV20DRAFT_1057052 [Pilatotrama ljubarskyi]
MASSERPSTLEDREAVTISSPKFKRVALLALQKNLLLLRIAKCKVDCTKGREFSRAQVMPCATNVNPEEAVSGLHAMIEDTFATSSGCATDSNLEAEEILNVILRAENNTQEILKALVRAHALHCRTLEQMGATKYAVLNLNAMPNGPDDSYAFELTAHDTDIFTISWPTRLGKRFLEAAMNAAQSLREAEEDPGFNDFIAFHLAYRDIMESGALLEAKTSMRFLGTIGFREHSQTYVSLTDPGEGHIFGTTRHSRWMTGAIVHNEHLERPKGIPRSQIESYRIPEIVDFACVRLHVGAQAPTTAYVGRFPHVSPSGNFEHEFLAAVNSAKALLSKFFDLGAAECKISMEDLTTSQMLKYMRALATVPRMRLQYLSAAFNIHPDSGSIIDDAISGSPVQLSTPMDICRRGIQLAAEGGFDKVTFDGASDTYPSVPIIKQLSFADALALVHEAHSVGLVTYMSAGFTFKNIKDAVYTAVDGIGLGGAQILRCMDKKTGMHGPYTEENIDRIKVEREDAEKSVRGRGALLLARLDQMHFEGSLTEAEAAIRILLYHALLQQDVVEVERILSEEPEAGMILSIYHDGEQPYVGRARRILRSEAPLLRMGAADDPVWAKFARTLRDKVAVKDEVGLQELYQEPTWTSIRAAYRQAIGDDKVGDRKKYFQGEPCYALKM